MDRNDAQSWKVRVLEARIDLLEGKSQEALLLLGPQIPGRLDNGDLQIQQGMFRAMAYVRLGRLPAATDALGKAQHLCDLTHSTFQAELLSIRGIAALENDETGRATSLFEQGLKLARQRGDQFLESTILLNLGVVDLRVEHYDQALYWSNAASETARPIGAQLVLEKALANVGFAYYQLGDFERALANFQEAEKRASSLGAASDQVRWLITGGDAQYELGRVQAAEAYYKKSLALAQSLQNSEEILGADVGLTSIFFQQDQLDLAAVECAKALRVADSIGSTSLESYPLFLQGLLFAREGKGQQALPIFLHLNQSLETPPSLRWKIENALAAVYGQSRDAKKAGEWYRRSIQTFERQRSSLGNEESKLPFFTNATSLYRDYASYLISKHSPSQALELLDFGRARTLEEGIGLASEQAGAAPSRNVDPQAIASRLRATILFYSLGPKESYLWAITPKQTHLFSVPREPEIEQHIRRYQQTILRSSDPLHLRDSDGIYLYKSLVGPAAALIARNSNVYVIPDGVLNGFNFETLLASNGNDTLHYWVDDVTVTTAPSLRVLSAFSPRIQQLKGKRLLLIGNPLPHGEDYPALANASLEIADIQRHFPREDLVSLTQNEAVPAAYAAHRPSQFAFVHFVAHGTASRLSPLDSAVVLSSSPAQPDDFKLYARDIVHLRLNAELVTISACYGSGTRIYAGEGLVGLSWAFLRAGSHNVIGALWPVSDASTPMLMDYMYGELAAGKPPAAALRAAKLSLLHSAGVFRKPFYWAAFQLYTGAFTSQR